MNVLQRIAPRAPDAHKLPAPPQPTLCLIVATNVLVLRGGPSLGPHLGLLHVYLPGYSVSFLGSVLGFLYAFVISYGAGRVIVSTFNRLTASER